MDVKTVIASILNNLSIETARSSGKGGQHVNKVETKVTLVCDLSTVGLPEEVLSSFENMSHRYLNYPVIRVSSEATRSQLKNKEQAVKKLTSFIEEALKVEVERKPTKVPKAVKKKRLETKKGNAQKKESRKKIDPKKFQ